MLHSDLNVRGGVLVLAATDQEAGDVPDEDGGVAVLPSLSCSGETQPVQHDSLQAEEVEGQTGGWITVVAVLSV